MNRKAVIHLEWLMDNLMIITLLVKSWKDEQKD